VRTLVAHAAVRGVVLALMALSAPGFTMVIHYCTMSRSSHCCCSGEEPSRRAQPRSPASLNSTVLSCNVQIVAGGLTPVAMNPTPDETAKHHVPDVSLVEPVVLTTSALPAHSLSTHSGDIPPPAGDLHLRTGALRI